MVHALKCAPVQRQKKIAMSGIMAVITEMVVMIVSRVVSHVLLFVLTVLLRVDHITAFHAMEHVIRLQIITVMDAGRDVHPHVTIIAVMGVPTAVTHVMVNVLEGVMPDPEDIIIHHPIPSVVVVMQNVQANVKVKVSRSLLVLTVVKSVHLNVKT